MEIRVWRSFSCNNSSSYRLVARFDEPAAAADAAKELAEFFAAHAATVDAIIEDAGFPDDPSETQEALGTKYGFEWSTVLTWGDDMLTDDEPSVAAEGDVLVVYHSYCGGFADLPLYLEAKGARDVNESTGAPHLSLLFRMPFASEALERDLAMLFAQVDESPHFVDSLQTPWRGTNCSGDASFFRDGKTVGLYFPFSPADLPQLKEWLDTHDIESPSLRLCEYGDEKRFAAIASARCTACSGALEYLDPRLHQIENEHLACAACGGMFELKTFIDALSTEE